MLPSATGKVRGPDESRLLRKPANLIPRPRVEDDRSQQLQSNLRNMEAHVTVLGQGEVSRELIEPWDMTFTPIQRAFSGKGRLGSDREAVPGNPLRSGYDSVPFLHSAL
jgi:hypothetical protein